MASNFYQRIILRDVTRQKPYKRALVFFRYSFYVFLALQVATYFTFFHNKVIVMYNFFKFAHTGDVVYMKPKAVIVYYDYMLMFTLFVSLNIIFLLFAFVHFDATQRNQMIAKLLSKEK